MEIFKLVGYNFGVGLGNFDIRLKMKIILRKFELKDQESLSFDDIYFFNLDLFVYEISFIFG